MYALEHPHHCINPGREGNTSSFDFKFLWNGRDHYDSLIGFETFCDTDTPGKQHVHVSQSTSTLTCPICENTFGTREMLRKHILRCTPQKSEVPVPNSDFLPAQEDVRINLFNNYYSDYNSTDGTVDSDTEVNSHSKLPQK